jgi:hypothetical protein
MEIRKHWNRLDLRRLSTVSRASQFFPSQTSRSFSTTRLSDAGRNLPLSKRYLPDRKTSATEVEQAVPCNNPLIIIENNQADNQVNNIKDIELNCSNSKPTENGHPSFDPNKLKFKINVVNIECRSRDGSSKFTTSLDIQALKNGRTVSTENIMNNNIEARSVKKLESGSEETDSLLDYKES